MGMLSRSAASTTYLPQDEDSNLYGMDNMGLNNNTYLKKSPVIY